MHWGAIYPGQGSQHLGMGKFLWENFPLVKECFEEASDAISWDMKRLCFDSSEGELALTSNTQPALLLVSVATHRVIRSLVPTQPLGGSGHSIGEYAALVMAQVLEFSSAIRAVRKRGEYMQAAVPVGQGGMTAVMGVSDEQCRELCLWAKKESCLTYLDPANFNCPGQVVISGEAKILEWLQKNYVNAVFSGEPPKRMKLIPLKVSAPFHSSLMKPAEEQMKKVLIDTVFEQALYPVVQNFNAQPVRDRSELRTNLIKQISAPVRWVECIIQLQKLGCKTLIEMGCGKVLTGLVKKICGEQMATYNVNTLDEIKILEKALISS